MLSDGVREHLVGGGFTTLNQADAVYYEDDSARRMGSVSTHLGKSRGVVWSLATEALSRIYYIRPA